MNLEQFQALKVRELADGARDPSAFDYVANLHVTDRGSLLVLEPRETPCDVPLVCVELKGKWRTLFLLFPDGHVEERDFGYIEPYAAKNVAYFVDHVPNPDAVEAWAMAMGYYVDDCSMDMMVGRWQIELAS